MIDRAAIARLVPQKGPMCLLARAVSYDRQRIVCQADSHLDPANPLRWDGRLGVLSGCEYGMQAAALHGALIAHQTLTAATGARLPDSVMVRTGAPSTSLSSHAPQVVDGRPSPAMTVPRRYLLPDGSANSQQAPIPGQPPPEGRVASLRVFRSAIDRLDDPSVGILTVVAERMAGDRRGLSYDFRLLAEDGRELLSGNGTVALVGAS